jgi:plasmid replication initiation protein
MQISDVYDEEQLAELRRSNIEIPVFTDIPRYVLQPNIISRSIYSLSTTARRLIAMAMALLPENAKDTHYRIYFSVDEFVKGLGLSYSGKIKELIFNAVNECLEATVKVNTPNGDWVGFTWFRQIRLLKMQPNFDTNELYWKGIEMMFNSDIGALIQEFKKAYAKLNLLDFGKIQSTYAIRFYEIAMSYAGFAGKDGNQKDKWYFEIRFKELRKLFKIENQYQRTGNFRTFIIDNPIKELNEAKIGIKITPEYIREGKFLVGVKFICEYTDKKPKKEAQKAIEAQEIPTPDKAAQNALEVQKMASPHSDKREDISPEEIEELREKHPAEWEKIYDEARQERIAFQEKIGMGIPLNEKMIEEITFARLKEHLGL